MNDQFNYKEIAEEQCNRRYHTEMWKDERVQVLKERAELLAENKRLRAALLDVLAECAIGGCAPDASSNCRTCRALVAIARALEQKP